MSISCASDLISFVQKKEQPFQILRQGARPVSGPCSLASPVRNAFSFFSKKKWEESNIDLSLISFLFLPDVTGKGDLEKISAQAEKYDATLLATKNPRLVFLEVLSEFYKTPTKPGIHHTATIAITCKVSESATISAGARLDENVVVGNHTVISENCVVGHGTKIGNNCFFAPGVAIGQPGFGYERDEFGKLIHFPHIGNVVIGNNVEVGANTCIDRGTLDNTYIGDGVKIDNLCHISHNVQLEKDCVVIANSMVGGSVRVGARSWLSPSSSILNGLTVGEEAVVGMGSVVVKPVPDKVTVLGSPAKTLNDLQRNKKDG